ncbi:MAG: hypothetical protein NTY66_00590 [Candidatus Vogelbacteria bacterium]|nr:hypothetical protein [Candidatus Vogelbacteria bacterium]
MKSCFVLILVVATLSTSCARTAGAERQLQNLSWTDQLKGAEFLPIPNLGLVPSASFEVEHEPASNLTRGVRYAGIDRGKLTTVTLFIKDAGVQEFAAFQARLPEIRSETRDEPSTFGWGDNGQPVTKFINLIEAENSTSGARYRALTVSTIDQEVVTFHSQIVIKSREGKIIYFRDMTK